MIRTRIDHEPSRIVSPRTTPQIGIPRKTCTRDWPINTKRSTQKVFFERHASQLPDLPHRPLESHLLGPGANFLHIFISVSTVSLSSRQVFVSFNVSNESHLLKTRRFEIKWLLNPEPEITLSLCQIPYSTVPPRTITTIPVQENHGISVSPNHSVHRLGTRL